MEESFEMSLHPALQQSVVEGGQRVLLSRASQREPSVRQSQDSPPSFPTSPNKERPWMRERANSRELRARSMRAVESGCGHLKTL